MSQLPGDSGSRLELPIDSDLADADSRRSPAPEVVLARAVDLRFELPAVYRHARKSVEESIGSLSRWTLPLYRSDRLADLVINTL